jgi:hypothetical protein
VGHFEGVGAVGVVGAAAQHRSSSMGTGTGALVLEVVAGAWVVVGVACRTEGGGVVAKGAWSLEAALGQLPRSLTTAGMEGAAVTCEQLWCVAQQLAPITVYGLAVGTRQNWLTQALWCVCGGGGACVCLMPSWECRGLCCLVCQHASVAFLGQWISARPLCRTSLWLNPLPPSPPPWQFWSGSILDWLRSALVHSNVAVGGCMYLQLTVVPRWAMP